MSYTMATLTDQAATRQRAIVNQVYLWMTAGLLVTGAVASLTANSPQLLDFIYGNTLIYFGLVIAELGLVIALSAAINRMSPAVATGVFLLYSMLTGLTISFIFLRYTNASIATTFFVSAGTFAAMSLFGYTTKRDLTAIGNLAFMGLIGIILASLVNFFIQSAAIYWAVTYIGIAIFIVLIARDTQKIKAMTQAATDDATTTRIAILGALMLYLDMINLFLLLLRILGRRR